MTEAVTALMTEVVGGTASSKKEWALLEGILMPALDSAKTLIQQWQRFNTVKPNVLCVKHCGNVIVGQCIYNIIRGFPVYSERSGDLHARLTFHE